MRILSGMYEYTYIIVIVHIVLQCTNILVLYIKYVYLPRKHNHEKKIRIIFLLVEGVGVHGMGDQGSRSSWFEKLTLG